MIVINLFGGPGCGKSTTAAWLFSELKRRNISCEYVTEFAKDLTWEENKKALGCQEYVFGNQSWMLNRLKDKVDVVITDSPLPLSIIYNHDRLPTEPFTKLVLSVFDSYDNVNIFLKRPMNYEQTGRNENQIEAETIDRMVFDMLLHNDMQAQWINVDSETFREDLLEFVLNTILKSQIEVEHETNNRIK